MGRILDRIRKDPPGDIWERVLVDGNPDLYTCGCAWRRDPSWGDVLSLCQIHRQASDALASEIERKR
jgi:hypothetical protein